MNKAYGIHMLSSDSSFDSELKCEAWKTYGSATPSHQDFSPLFAKTATPIMMLLYIASLIASVAAAKVALVAMPTFTQPAPAPTATSSFYVGQNNGSIPNVTVIPGLAFDRYIQIWLENMDFEVGWLRASSLLKHPKALPTGMLKCSRHHHQKEDLRLILHVKPFRLFSWSYWCVFDRL